MLKLARALLLTAFTLSFLIDAPAGWTRPAHEGASRRASKEEAKPRPGHGGARRGHGAGAAKSSDKRSKEAKKQVREERAERRDGVGKHASRADHGSGSDDDPCAVRPEGRDTGAAPDAGGEKRQAENKPRGEKKRESGATSKAGKTKHSRASGDGDKSRSMRDRAVKAEKAKGADEGRRSGRAGHADAKSKAHGAKHGKGHGDRGSASGERVRAASRAEEPARAHRSRRNRPKGHDGAGKDASSDSDEGCPRRKDAPPQGGAAPSSGQAATPPAGGEPRSDPTRRPPDLLAPDAPRMAPNPNPPVETFSRAARDAPTELKALAGRDLAQITAWFGQPVSRNQIGDGGLWTYRLPSCALMVFLARSGSAFKVTGAEVGPLDPGGGQPDAEACLKGARR